MPGRVHMGPAVLHCRAVEHKLNPKPKTYFIPTLNLSFTKHAVPNECVHWRLPSTAKLPTILSFEVLRARISHRWAENSKDSMTLKWDSGTDTILGW